MGLLDGKVAAITGAGGGIGRAHALLFAREGARVLVNDVGTARDGSGAASATADAVVKEIIQAGGEACAYAGDIASEEGADNLVALAVSKYGRLDILVNNAGILRDKTLLKMTTDMFDTVNRVHLRGTFLCTRAAARHMTERSGGGRIINTSSVSGLLGNFGQSNYAAAKAGIYGFTMTCALELKRHGITVNALAPVALTRMTEDLPMMKAQGPAAEALSPDHIAPAALFLASDLAAEVTGTILAVEGRRMYRYQMTTTPAVTPPEGERWTAAMIHDHWHKISGGTP